MINKIASRIFNFLASLELAVILIVVLAIAFAVGTVFESVYDAKVAKAVVYHAWWMNIMLLFFITNVAAAALSRWPWKKHHIGFLVTHLGIIILLVGSIMTMLQGVDGIMALREGESSKRVELAGNVLNVYKTVQGQSYELVFSEDIWFNEYHRLKEPLEFDLKDGKNKLVIDKYWPKAERKTDARKVGNGSPAIKFRLSGSRANISEWLFLTGKDTSSLDLGPAIVQFRNGVPPKRLHTKNTLYIYFEQNRPKQLKLATFRANSEERIELGPVELNKSTPVGWMDFNIMVQKHMLSAAPKLYYIPMEKRIPGMGAAAAIDEVIHVKLGDEDSWLSVGSSAQISAGDAVYFVQYIPRTVDIGFAITLQDFRIRYYEGSNKPMSYESTVKAFDTEHLIAMNEPLKSNGFTFYQSSYTTDEQGKPVYSVLSVNRDPGRIVKYLGSLMITLGIMLMFWFKPMYSGSNKFLKNMGKPEDA